MRYERKWVFGIQRRVGFTKKQGKGVTPGTEWCRDGGTPSRLLRSWSEKHRVWGSKRSETMDERWND